jgi:hypothetical protein
MKEKRKKIFVSVGIFILIMTVLIIGIILFLTQKAEKILHEKLVSSLPAGQYSLDYGELNANILGGLFTVNDIHFNLNDSLSVKFQKLTVKRIDNLFWEFIKNKKMPLAKLQVQLENGTIHFPDSLYILSVGKIALNLKDSLLKVNDITYVSTIPKWQFAYQDPNHSSWMDLKLGTIELKGIHIQQLMEEKTILLDSLFISDVDFSNYKNHKIPVARKSKPLIYESVQKLPIPFTVNYLKASNLNIFYEELAKNGTEPGLIKFTQMEGIFDKGITNTISSHTQTNRLIASGKLMNEGLINAELYFPVDSTYDNVTIKGTLGTMNMISLNSIIEPLTPVRIKSGFIQHMDYHIQGGREKAEIYMCLNYNDLSVQMLLPIGDKRLNIGLLSLLATGLIEKNNPEEGKEIRCVSAEQIRDPYRSSFNYLWKIYLSGLEETLGYTKRRQENVNWVLGILHKGE